LTPTDKAYLTLFRNFHDGLFKIDLTGKYLLVNALYADIFGYTPEDILEGGFDI